MDYTAEAIPMAALNALQSATWENHVQGIRLHGQLDRKTYQQVNEVLSRLGGKWNRHKNAHVFDFDAESLLRQTLETKAYPVKNPFDFFETPEPLVQHMIDLARFDLVLPTDSILEPSAGHGAIADGIKSRLHELELQSGILNSIIRPGLFLCEIDPVRQKVLIGKGYNPIIREDFLTQLSTQTFARVLMNPPFTSATDSLAYIAHIMHAWNFLAPNGILVSIAPIGFTFRSDKRCAAFMEFVEQNGFVEMNSPDAFKSSGTSVRTATIVLEKAVR